MADIRRQIKDKGDCIFTLQEKANNFDKLAEYLKSEQIKEMIKEVEEIRKMHNREMNKYYEEWSKKR